MKTAKSSPHLFLTLKPFREAPAAVYTHWPARYKEGYANKLFGLQLSDNSRMLYLLLPKLITQTILRFTMRRIGTCYNPHSQIVSSVVWHIEAPRSGFVHRV